jgi:hypothetical protein
MSEIFQSICQKIYKKTKSRSGKTIFNKQLKGIMIAGIIDDRPVIGYSLCHKNDMYDFVGKVRRPGWGKTLAITRAIKWRDNEVIEVPPSIIKEARKFVKRCEKYYKGAVIQVINEMPVEYSTARY